MWWRSDTRMAVSSSRHVALSARPPWLRSWRPTGRQDSLERPLRASHLHFPQAGGPGRHLGQALPGHSRPQGPDGSSLPRPGPLPGPRRLFTNSAGRRRGGQGTLTHALGREGRGEGRGGGGGGAGPGAREGGRQAGAEGRAPPLGESKLGRKP